MKVTIEIDSTEEPETLTALLNAVQKFTGAVNGAPPPTPIYAEEPEPPPEPKKAKKKRATKKKAEKPKEEGKEIKLDDLRAACIEFAHKYGPEKVRVAIQKAGAEKIDDLDPANYPKVVQHLGLEL